MKVLLQPQCKSFQVLLSLPMTRAISRAAAVVGGIFFGAMLRIEICYSTKDTFLKIIYDRTWCRKLSYYLKKPVGLLLIFFYSCFP